MPSFSMRLRSVFGWSLRIRAAPLGPWKHADDDKPSYAADQSIDQAVEPARITRQVQRHYQNGGDRRLNGNHGSQIAVMPPSTGRSTPAMKLASSDARNKAVDAISSGRPSRPNGTAAANWARAWSAPSLVGACWSKIGVSIGPGLIALTRMRRSFNSAVQVRTKERTAALGRVRK